MSCVFFYLKAGLHFLSQVMCHVYLFIFLHLSKVLHFNLLGWHSINISPAICLCWQLRDFLSDLSFVGRKGTAVTEKARSAVGAGSALSEMGGGNRAILSGSKQVGSLWYFLLLKCCHGQDILLQHLEGFGLVCSDEQEIIFGLRWLSLCNISLMQPGKIWSS